jgi:transposase
MPIFDETFSHTARALVKMLLILEDEIKNIQNKMTEITTNHPLGNIFYSLPGSGEVLAPKLLSVMGDNKKVYSNSIEIQAYSGVAPVIKRSGKSSLVQFRIACNKEYRNILTYFAFCSLSCSPWARKYYDRARLKGKRHYESLRLLAYKWTRIIFKLWQTGEVYSEEYHTKNLERFNKNILQVA